MASYSIRGAEEPPLPPFEGHWDILEVHPLSGDAVVTATQVLSVHAAAESFISELTIIQPLLSASASGLAPKDEFLLLPASVPESFIITHAPLEDLLAALADLRRRDCSWVARSTGTDDSEPRPDVPRTTGPFVVDPEGNFIYYTDIETYRSLGLGTPVVAGGRELKRQLPRERGFYTEPVASFARCLNPLLSLENHEDARPVKPRIAALARLAGPVERSVVGWRGIAVPPEVARLLPGKSIAVQRAEPWDREWRLVRDPSIQLPPGADPFAPERLQIPTINPKMLEQAESGIVEDIMEFLGRVVCGLPCDAVRESVDEWWQSTTEG